MRNNVSKNIEMKKSLSESVSAKDNEIKSLIIGSSDESDYVKISKSDVQLKMDLMSRNDDELKNIFKSYNELFDKIDNLVD